MNGADKEKQEWYSNKDLYEMMVDLSKGLEKTNAELEKTQVLIRDYNGLRTIINQCKEWQDKHDGQASTQQSGWEKFGYFIGLAGVVVAIIAIVTK